MRPRNPTAAVASFTWGALAARRRNPSSSDISDAHKVGHRAQATRGDLAACTPTPGVISLLMSGEADAADPTELAGVAEMGTESVEAWSLQDEASAADERLLAR